MLVILKLQSTGYSRNVAISFNPSHKKTQASNKQDVTIEALVAVANHVLQFGKPVEIEDTHHIYNIDAHLTAARSIVLYLTGCDFKMKV